MPWSRLCIALLGVALTACSGLPAKAPAAPTASAAEKEALPSALDRLVLHDRLAVSPQPTADDLRALKAQGYTRIVNLRTPSEVDNRSTVPFDEAALAEELGLDYVHLPQGGDDYPFRADLPDGLAEALQGEGKVLVHCASGARASQVYAAYAVKHLGVDPDTALRQAVAFGQWPLPLERMTGVKLRVVRADED